MRFWKWCDWTCGVEADGRTSRQNDRRAMRYGIWNLPLAHARGSATLGFGLPEPRPLGSGWLSLPPQAPLDRWERPSAGKKHRRGGAVKSQALRDQERVRKGRGSGPNDGSARHYGLSPRTRIQAVRLPRWYCLQLARDRHLCGTFWLAKPLLSRDDCCSRVGRAAVPVPRGRTCRGVIHRARLRRTARGGATVE